MRRSAALVALLAPFLGPVVTAGAQEEGWRNDPATYPVASFLDWTGSPARDAQDPDGVGRYNFEAGIAGAGRRALERYPEHYDPEKLAGPDGFQHLADETQVAVDAFGHNRPKLPHDHPTDAGHPAYMPDWNHDGVFGDGGGPDESSGLEEAVSLGRPGDFDADTDASLDRAFFRYPCANLDGSVDYETIGGGCRPAGAPGEIFRLGVAEEVKIVNARGLVLDGTVWAPGHAFAPEPVEVCDQAGVCTLPAEVPASLVRRGGAGEPAKLPGVVFSNGLSSRQEHYYWFVQRMVREGFLALGYDPAGQGESEGTWMDLFDPIDQDAETAEDAPIEGCRFGGACRDAQDAVRWFAGEEVVAIVDDLGEANDPLDPATYREEFEQAPEFRQESNFAEGRYRSPFVSRRDPAANAPNPVLAALDTTRLSLAGNSMGALSTLNYLHYLCGGGTGADGRPLPPVAAAVSLSGGAPTGACAPIQFQTSDYDGSPALVGPTVFGLYLGNPDPTATEPEGIGYGPIKATYDVLRDDPARAGDLSLVVLEGGVHTDHAAVPFVTRTLWSIAVASDYGAAWLRCHVTGDTAACDRAVSRHDADPAFCDSPGYDPATASGTDDPGCDHLSRAFASEEAPAGGTTSFCIKAPDRASLNQEPADFVEAYAGGGPPPDCVR